MIISNKKFLWQRVMVCVMKEKRKKKHRVKDPVILIYYHSHN